MEAETPDDNISTEGREMAAAFLNAMFPPHEAPQPQDRQIGQEGIVKSSHVAIPQELHIGPPAQLPPSSAPPPRKKIRTIGVAGPCPQESCPGILIDEPHCQILPSKPLQGPILHGHEPPQAHEIGMLRLQRQQPTHGGPPRPVVPPHPSFTPGPATPRPTTPLPPMCQFLPLRPSFTCQLPSPPPLCFHSITVSGPSFIDVPYNVTVRYNVPELQLQMFPASEFNSAQQLGSPPTELASPPQPPGSPPTIPPPPTEPYTHTE